MSTELQDDDIESIVDFLSEEGGIRIYFGDEADLDSYKDVPAAWKHVMSGKHEKLNRILLQWESVTALVPKTVSLLRTRLLDVALLFSQTKPLSLVYFFKEEDEVFGQRGFPPANAEVLQRIPVPIRNLVAPLYQMHNGWIDLFSADGGPLPIAEWDITRRPGTDSSGGFLTVFSNGSNRVGFDLDSAAPNAFALWPSDDEITPIDDFWEFVDEQMALSLEDCEMRNDT